MREHLATVSRNAPRPSIRDRFVSYGPDPIRILLIGNGIALGYGVTNRSDTLDGHIGARVATATRRGVVVNNHTHDSSRLVEQAQSVVAGMNLQTEDIVVWCPSYSEVLHRSGPGYWRETMATFLSNVAPSVSVVLVEVPAIDSTDFDARFLSTSIKGVNHALRSSARNHANVTVCEPPRVEFVLGRDHLYDAAYYELVGEAVATVVLRQRFGIEGELGLVPADATAQTSPFAGALS